MRRRSIGSLLGRLRSIVLLLALGLASIAPALAQPTEPRPAEPAAIQELLRLLADPQVRAWAEARTGATPATATPAPAERSAQHLLATGLADLRGHLMGLAAAVPMVGPELARAWAVLQGEMTDHGLWGVLVLVLGFAASGFVVEQIYWRLTAAYRRDRIAKAGVASPRARLVGLARRMMVSVGWVCSFAVGSIGAFLIFDWPPLLRTLVLSYLLAFLAARLVLVVGRVLVHPFSEKFRTVPLAPEVGRFWWLWSGIFTGWIAFALATREVLVTLGVDVRALSLVMPAFGIVSVAILLWGVWGRPLLTGVDGEPPPARHGWLWTGVFAGLWLLRSLGFMPLFWLAAVAVTLPVALRLTRRTVAYVLRQDPADEPGHAVAPFAALCLERGLRTLWILLAALVVVRALGFDLGTMAEGDTMRVRALRGAVDALVIVLVAEFLWHAVRAWIDGQIAAAVSTGSAEEVVRRARLRTLLPILRNVLLVVLVVMAGLMALSAIGIEIGPLVAGAGVVGVAVGFGAQTLVKDVISGMFYLFDDAFRVGEYISSGSYKGTVESFSLRSVKLRHHRGPLTTVPFGELGAVQNMSRDWVIDKISLGVEYGTDLDKVKRIIKQIGKDLWADPEFQPHIIDTLKMQGVESFGDYAIQIRLKLTTKPGEQFVIRRRAYAMIQKAFAANGIKFAFPTVQVAGGSDSDAVVARQAIEMVKPAEASAA